ncbi:hypothetical protein [Macrococcus bovicus]|uniref:WDGH domain-containing protein n=1 Tax=Macrococcus bovicus TaxID=69968 RepID=UPI001AA0A74E|nr:hypothetical protein [Macrococcus bovicus]
MKFSYDSEPNPLERLLNAQIAELKEDGAIATKNLSDGYHTIGQLYHDRAILFAVICNTYKENAFKSKLHDDGTMYDDMFIVGLYTPEGTYTYHYHMEYWDMYDVEELKHAPAYDGHTFKDIGRLFGLVGSK